MRVSTNQVQQLAVESMLQQQAKVSKTQLQVSSGRRILTPSDDPAGSTNLLGLNEVISKTEQYQRNAGAAQSRLNLEESVLQGSVDLLQRARELAVRAVSDSYNAKERAGAAKEVRQLLDQMVGLANTRDSNGEYLFAGYRTDTVPFVDNGNGTFTYNGDQGERKLQIGPSRHVVVGDSGARVFIEVSNSSRSVFGSLEKLASDLENNTPDPSVLDDIDASMDNILLARTDIGARLNAIEGQRNVNDAAVLQTKQARSSIEDLDYAEAVGRLNSQMTALQAAQQSFVRVQGLSLFNYLG
jgi:flagellar hook-associated protein 3 FlgL